LEGLAMEDVGTFYGHFVYFMAFWQYFMYGFLVHFMVIWYTFHVWVNCSKKNLATLDRMRIVVFSLWRTKPESEKYGFPSKEVQLGRTKKIGFE
jgi:hypothetical protein